MSNFIRPTLAALIARAQSDIETELPGSNARLRRANWNILAKVHAMAMHAIYGFLSWLSDQLFVGTCSPAFLPRYAAQWNVPQLPAAYALGPAIVSGIFDATVPAGTVLQRSDGAQFLVRYDVTFTSGLAELSLTATVAGAAGNTAAGTTLTFVSPVDSVSADCTVDTDGISGGADVEDPESWRARILLRIRKPPMGGAASDYVEWALQVPGVTRAWCYPLETGPGSVVVRFVRDDDDDFIPSGGEVATVQAYIDALRPVTVPSFSAAAPIATAVNYTIHVTPDTTAVRAAVQAELADMHRRVAIPSGALSIVQIQDAIASADGLTDYDLVSPTATVAMATGHIATLGTNTW